MYIGWGTVYSWLFWFTWVNLVFNLYIAFSIDALIALEEWWWQAQDAEKKTIDDVEAGENAGLAMLEADLFECGWILHRSEKAALVQSKIYGDLLED